MYNDLIQEFNQKAEELDDISEEVDLYWDQDWN